MNKHGVENFIIEEILNCEESEMFYLEIEFIKQFDSYNTGYNSTFGGEGCLGYKHSEETLIKTGIRTKLLWERADYNFSKSKIKIKKEIEQERLERENNIIW
jgi:hypothetical protein